MKPNLNKLVNAAVKIVREMDDAGEFRGADRESMEGGRKLPGTLYAVSVYAYLAYRHGYSFTAMGEALGRPHTKMMDAYNRIDWGEGVYAEARRRADAWRADQ